MTTTNLTLEAARQRLRPLGLYGLLAQAETLMHEPWFARVLEIKDAERARRSLKRRLEDARLGAFKPITDFEWGWPTKCDRSLVEELFSLAFIQEAANVVFVGPNGLGKTMLLKNLAYQAVLHGHTARYTLASDGSTTSPHRIPPPRWRAACTATPRPPSSPSTKLAICPTTLGSRRSALRGGDPSLPDPPHSPNDQ